MALQSGLMALQWEEKAGGTPPAPNDEFAQHLSLQAVLFSSKRTRRLVVRLCTKGLQTVSDAAANELRAIGIMKQTPAVYRQ